jgi:hypothetical protein
MSGTKRIVEPTYLANAASLAADYTSPSLPLKYMDRAMLVITTTGTPTGQVSVQASADNVDFYDLPLNIAASSGSGDTFIIDIQTTAVPYVRVKYTWTSGTGTLTAVVTAKES